MSGWADGALSGLFPGPGMGAPHSAGYYLADDFTDLATSRWTATTIVAAPTYAMVAPTAYTEHGIHRTTTAATLNSGGVLLRSSVADLYRVPPPGSRWAVKIRTSASASYDLWSGFSSTATDVRTATAGQFIGVRQDRAVGSNLYGVVKSAAATETAIDLGVTCEGSVWRAVGFDVEGTAAAPSIQFYLYDLTDRLAWMRQPIGSAITANRPLSACSVT